MCEALNVRPTFKGVVVITSSIVLAFFTLVGSAVPLDQVQPYCIYLEQSQELRCNCQNFPFNRSQASVFPNNDFFVAAPSQRIAEKVKQVAAMKLSGCQQLHLKLDFRALPYPFYRLRIDNVPEVVINEVYLRPNDTIDVWFSGIHQNLTFQGEIKCPDCLKQELDVENLTSFQKPKINFHIVKSGPVLLDNFVKEAHTSDLNIKVRDLESLTIIDSYFGGLNSSNLELFNVPSVYLMHSEFHYCTSGFLIANTYVKNITIVDCLLEDSAITLLSNDTTKVTKRCSMSPLGVAMDHNGIIQRLHVEPECQNSAIGRWMQNNGNMDNSVEATGAITLALISSFMLLTVIVVLYTAHRQGKLDAYL